MAGQELAGVEEVADVKVLHVGMGARRVHHGSQTTPEHLTKQIVLTLLGTRQLHHKARGEEKHEQNEQNEIPSGHGETRKRCNSQPLSL